MCAIGLRASNDFDHMDPCKVTIEVTPSETNKVSGEHYFKPYKIVDDKEFNFKQKFGVHSWLKQKP